MLDTKLPQNPKAGTVKKLSLYISAILMLTVVSCSRNLDSKNQDNQPKKYEGQITLTDEEILGLAYATPHEISPEKAVALVKDFQNKMGKAPQTKSSDKNSYSVLKKTYLSKKGMPLPSTLVLTKGDFQNNISVYNVLVNSGDAQSIAYVSADERMPDVIAVVPTKDGVTLNEHSFDPMLLLAQKSLAQNVSDLNAFVDSINRPTIKKLEDKFGPLPKTDLYSLLKENIKSKAGSTIKTKSEVQGTITNILSQVGPLMSSYWHQDPPFNEQVPVSTTCAPNYPAGCLVVAASQILGYYQPSMNIKVNNVSTPMQWGTLMSNPNGTDAYGGSYNYDATAKPLITGLIKTVYDATSSTPDCNGSLTTSQNAINYLKNFFTMDNTNHTPGTNMTTIKSSLDQLKLVLATGSRIPDGSTTKSSHAWILDGYAVTRLNPGETIVGNNVWQRYNMYLHANMGWGEPTFFYLHGTGWYLVGKDNNGTLTFKANPVQEWSLNLTFYPNFVKK